MRTRPAWATVGECFKGNRTKIDRKDIACLPHGKVCFTKGWRGVSQFAHSCLSSKQNTAEHADKRVRMASFCLSTSTPERTRQP